MSVFIFLLGAGENSGEVITFPRNCGEFPGFVPTLAPSWSSQSICTTAQTILQGCSRPHPRQPRTPLRFKVWLVTDLGFVTHCFVQSDDLWFPFVYLFVRGGEDSREGITFRAISAGCCPSELRIWKQNIHTKPPLWNEYGADWACFWQLCEGISNSHVFIFV